MARWPGARDFLLRGNYFWFSVLIFKKKKIIIIKWAHVVNKVGSPFLDILCTKLKILRHFMTADIFLVIFWEIGIRVLFVFPVMG